MVADGEEYGAEEAEEELEEEAVEGTDGVADADAMIDEAEPINAQNDQSKAVDEESDAGSEDLEAESSGSDEDEAEAEVEEEEHDDEAMELDVAEKPDDTGINTHSADTVMTH